jgi:tRNA(fMet)-specific endonuclease VapC
MVMTHLLDTNVIIELLRGRGEPLRRRLAGQSGLAQGMAVSTVSVFELEYGVQRAPDPAKAAAAMAAALRNFHVAEFDRRAAEEAGRVRAHLARQGTPIGPYDVLLAGHARALGLTMVTANVGEFGRVPGLETVDWLA